MQSRTIGQRFGNLLGKGRARTAEETRLMRLLGLLIEDYDRRHAMPPDDSTPADRLQFLLEHSGKSSDDLMALPHMTNPEKVAVMRIIADITSSRRCRTLHREQPTTIARDPYVPGPPSLRFAHHGRYAKRQRSECRCPDPFASSRFAYASCAGVRVRF